jgi:hypothetical protein
MFGLTLIYIKNQVFRELYLKIFFKKKIITFYFLPNKVLKWHKINQNV